MDLSLEAATEVTNVDEQNLSILEISSNSKTKTLNPYAGSSSSLEGSTQPETRLWGCRFWLWQSQTSSG